MSRCIVLALVALLAVSSPAAAAASPTEDLRTHVDIVIKTLQTKDGTPQERRAAVRKVAAQIFDFEETAKRSLGPHWQARTPAERQEFVTLFTDLLEHAYFSKIEQYGGEKVAYLGDTLNGDLATVRSKIVTPKGTEIPIDYRMLRRNGRWLVYDVIIEGVSLVGNYRTQFNKIIQTSSWNDLMQRLRSKSLGNSTSSTDRRSQLR
jgi:phospholipid transport system substrate-binding protein